MKAIRVEHSDGFGMFWIYDSNDKVRGHNAMYVAYNLDVRHSTSFPTPYINGRFIKENEFCAYRSIQQFKKWVFKDELYSLVKSGYRVYRLELDDHYAIKLENQIIYKKKGIIKKTDITERLLS